MQSAHRHRTVSSPGPALAARARYFRVLGDRTRLHLLEILLSGARTVAELAAVVRAPRSRISNHLACLKWCRFVTADRQGRHVVYRVADHRAGTLIDAARSLTAGRRDHLARCRRIGPAWI
ncbi:MAG TPA: metalloregulator ArsR/SmtB family transcription factor [bacterium]|nr:metalloregulator ArsR/SmtB family transcription factor [bacterium]